LRISRLGQARAGSRRPPRALCWPAIRGLACIRINARRGRARQPGTAMHEQMSLRCIADLPAKDQEAFDIFAGRGDLVGLRLDHIMKALDQPPVRRERVELGGQPNSSQGHPPTADLRHDDFTFGALRGCC
jgi:hypothetical protein